MKKKSSLKKSQYRLDLEKEVKPMLQEANAKLLNLEKLSKKEGFEGVNDYAYRVAVNEIRKIRGEEYKYFNMPKNTHQLEKTKRALEKFLDSPTSTKAGIESIYEKNAASLNEKFGSDFDWKDMGNFLRAAGFEDIKAQYDSETAILMMKALYKNKDISKDEFIEKLENHQIKGLDEVDSDTLADFTKTDIEWDELFPVED